MKSTLVNMVSVLGTITLVSALAVSGFYLLTKDAIDYANQQRVDRAIGEVITGFDNVPSEEMFLYPASEQFGGDSLQVFPAKSGDKLLGYAVKTFSPNGYAGNVQLMVGVLADRTISAVSVVSEAETPGLGHKMSTEGVLVDQFKNIDPKSKVLAVKKDKGDIDAITAATISSRAFCDAVNRALSVTDALFDVKSSDAVTGATSVKKGGKK